MKNILYELVTRRRENQFVYFKIQLIFSVGVKKEV